MNHARQHYVPKFLLKRWATGGKVWRHTRPQSDLLTERKSVDSCAWLPHLYSINADTSPDPYIETGLLSPIDNDASIALDLIDQRGVRAVQGSSHALAWHNFLMAQMYRVPAMVKTARVHGRKVVEDACDTTDVDRLATFGMTAEEHKAWVAKIPKHLYDDLGLQMMPQLVRSARAHGLINGSTWRVINFPDDVLIGDNPLIFSRRNDNDYLMALPIGRNRIFFCSKGGNWLKLFDLPLEDILSIINKIEVSKAKSMIISATRENDQYINEHFLPINKSR